MKTIHDRKIFDFLLNTVKKIGNPAGVRQFCNNEIFKIVRDKSVNDYDILYYDVKILSTFPEIESILEENTDETLGFTLFLYEGDESKGLKFGYIKCESCFGRGYRGGGSNFSGPIPKEKCYNNCMNGWKYCPECNSYGNGRNLGQCSSCKGNGYR